MESSIATLKKEIVHHEKYETRSKVRHSLFESIEVFYNRVRRISATSRPPSSPKPHNPNPAPKKTWESPTYDPGLQASFLELGHR
ncbi:IS3 family transposase [bacterium]|nr:IS3 family transposase [bacterium]